MLKVINRLLTTGSEQSILIPRATDVMIQCTTVALQLRTVSGSTEYFTIGAGIPYSLTGGPSQTLYLTGTAGNYIEIMFRD